jgi:hypothetical protein
LKSREAEKSARHTVAAAAKIIVLVMARESRKHRALVLAVVQLIAFNPVQISLLGADAEDCSCNNFRLGKKT